jgi:hypothetical protein
MSTYSETTPNKDMLNNEIAQRAHELFMRRGCEPGHDLDDWLQAERELDGPARSASEDWREDLRKPSPQEASGYRAPQSIRVEPNGA